MIEIRRKETVLVLLNRNQFWRSRQRSRLSSPEKSLTFEWSEQLSVRLIGVPALQPLSRHLTAAPLRTVLFISETDKRFVVLLYEIYISWHSWHRIRGSVHQKSSERESVVGLKPKLIILRRSERDFGSRTQENESNRESNKN